MSMVDPGAAGDDPRSGVGASSAGAFARLSAAVRTSLHAGTVAALARTAHTFDRPARDAHRAVAREAFALQMALAEHPQLRAVLRRTEIEDLVTFPALVSLMPLEVMRIARKRREGVTRRSIAPGDDYPYPEYYLTDFHNQPNGHLSMRAALLHEWQNRLDSLGTHRLMRQSVIDCIPEGRHLDVLDVGCGTAAWITQARLQQRMHRVTGVDLSPQYLRVARALRGARTSFRQLNAEELPLEWSQRFDLCTAMWLFHEVPPAAAGEIAGEIARVLKPGGRLLFLDRVQRAQCGAASYLSEPHLSDYQSMDLERLFRESGLHPVRHERVFTSQLLVLERR